MSNATADPVKNWEITASTGKHFDVLDGIRGIAILMVVATHTFYTNPATKLAMFKGLLENFNVGVPIFFVLSGFLISYPFFRQKKTGSTSWYVKNYARRRIGKILPPYYLSIILFTTWYLMAFSDTHYLAVAGLWASGLANFIQPALPFNASYWSLIVEAHFYILLPILFWLYRGAGLRTTCLNIFLTFLVVPLAARQWSWPDPVDYDRLIFLLVRFPSQLDFFGWGILFSGLYASLSATRQNFQALGLLGYAGVLLLLISLGLLAHWTTVYNVHAQPQRWSVEASHFLTGLSAFLMLFFVFDPASIGSRFFSNAPLRFVGIVSYEWFLFHQPVVNYFRHLTGGSSGSAANYAFRTLLPLALTFGFSVLVYRFFSLPLLNYIRRDHKAAAKPKAA